MHTHLPHVQYNYIYVCVPPFSPLPHPRYPETMQINRTALLGRKERKSDFFEQLWTLKLTKRVKITLFSALTIFINRTRLNGQGNLFLNSSSSIMKRINQHRAWAFVFNLFSSAVVVTRWRTSHHQPSAHQIQFQVGNENHQRLATQLPPNGTTRYSPIPMTKIYIYPRTAPPSRQYAQKKH